MKPERFREIAAKSKVETPTFNHAHYGAEEFIYDAARGEFVNISTGRRSCFNVENLSLADFRHIPLSRYKAFGL